jgi:hypothetical protein
VGAWWKRQVATWGMVLALVVPAGIALAWRAHVLAHPRYPNRLTWPGLALRPPAVPLLPMPRRAA